MLRSNFEKDLNKLHVDLDKMCHLVILSIENCITAFKSGDRDLCRDILAGDKLSMIWKERLKLVVYH